MNALLVFFTLCVSAGVLFLDGMAGYGVFKQFKSRRYPTAAGKVTQSEVKSYSDSHGRTSYDAVINYRFEVGGQAFTGSRLRYTFTSSDYASVRSMVAAHSAGAAVQVFFNPANRRDSLLLPGLNGSDFMIGLFVTPFNAVMIGFWICTGGWLRQRLSRPVAGGVKIIAGGMSTRVRLPQFGAAALGLLTTGGLGFVFVLIVAFSTKMQPSIRVVLPLLGVTYLAGAGVFLRQWRKIVSGFDDLVINDGARTLDLPPTLGRKERMTASITDIESLTVEKIEHRSSKGGISYTYAPTLRLRGANAGEQKLADWSDRVKAEDFGAWLHQKLGLCCPPAPIPSIPSSLSSLKVEGVALPSRLSSEVQLLARDPAKKINAIKLHREQTGLGLAEAKAQVEAFMKSVH